MIFVRNVPPNTAALLGFGMITSLRLFCRILSALYVKWLEAAGLLVAPIAYNIGDKELDYLMSSLNGVLFTGGDLYLTPNTTYYQTSRKIFDKVKFRKLAQRLCCVCFSVPRVHAAFSSI